MKRHDDHAIVQPASLFLARFRLLVYRGVGELFAALELSLVSISALLPKTRTSNPLSKLLRPALEYQRLRGIVGIQLVVALTVVGLAGSPISADFPSGSNDSYETEISVVEAPRAVVVTTERQFQMPVSLIGVSQGFHRYHPGVDLRAPLGSIIQPISEGVVSDVVYGQWGYGQAVIVEHEAGYSSMYAHVGRIFVEAGSDVDRSSAIAEVGMTGYSTGPHLHLEVYKDGVVINPQSLLGY